MISKPACFKIIFTGFLSIIVTITILISCSIEPGEEAISTTGIDISSKYPTYWTYNGKETLLLGGSVEDNLFQIPGLAEHLDLLISAGGNYVRNTMSSRDTGNVWAHKMLENGLYDLSQWNDEYWRRFETFLEETAKRDIIVQIEIWATFDYYRDDFFRQNWDINPFNPKNNINYDEHYSKLPLTVDSHPVRTENNFFRSVPSQMALWLVLWYQQKFVDKILSYTLLYEHILYCMNNETSVTSDWGKYWAEYIQKRARLAGKKVHTTDMWNPRWLNHPFHAETFDNPEIFTFIEFSQNNHQSGDNHWNNAITQIEELKILGLLRPINNVKIYGHDDGLYKTTRDAVENFIKNLFIGCASSRFHRPPAGQGLNATAQAVIRSMRELSDKMNFFEGKPNNDILLSRGSDGAYCRVIPGKEYAVYFPDGGSVELDLSDFRSVPVIEWLDVLNSNWLTSVKLEKTLIKIETPDKGHWVALIK